MRLKSFFGKLVSPMIWLNLLAMVVVVALMIWGLKRWLDDYTHHGEGITVPDFCGKSYDSSVSEGNTIGLIVVANDSSYNKTMPAGCVVVQKPEAGATVKEGRIVYVTINSLTMPRVAIPDVVGNSSYRNARLQLEGMGFKVTEPKLIDGDKDWVYGLQCGGRNVMAGDMVAKESVLTLVIGNGITDEELEFEEIDEDDEVFELFPEDNDYDEVDPFFEISEE